MTMFLWLSTKNGNFIVVAEHNVPGESGEAAFGALFGPNGTVLTPGHEGWTWLNPPAMRRPDVVYLPRRMFLYISNTDGGPLFNHIVGSVIQTTPSGGNLGQRAGAKSLYGQRHARPPVGD
jgi:hypothetical protein